jgi:uncharacterized protein YjbI with pentapeptide repeats
MKIARLAALIGVPIAFAGGIVVYAAAQTLWSRLIVGWPWLLTGVAGIALYGAWWLWWRLPQREVERRNATLTDAKAQADVEDNFRKTIGQLLGGAAVLIGAGFAYLQFIQQQKSAHDVLISNQVAKGFELLGNKEKDTTQRLGGIYALEGVMNTDEHYHMPVFEALCAFVRDGTKNGTGDGPPASDIQAALTVIGRRAKMDENGGPNLANARIQKADLRHAYLFGADLRGTNLTGANLTGADLTIADLTIADLSGTNLSGANLFLADLTGARLSGAQGLNQKQLDEACATNVETPAGLTIKPCPQRTD